MADWFSNETQLDALKKQLNQKDIRCANLQGDLVKRENELKEVQDGLKEVQYKLHLEADRAMKLEDELLKLKTSVQKERIVRENMETALYTANKKLEQQEQSWKAIDHGASSELYTITKERDELRQRLEQTARANSMKNSSAVDLEAQVQSLQAENARLRQLPPSLTSFGTPNRHRTPARGRPRASSVGDARVPLLENELEQSRQKLETLTQTSQQKISKLSSDLLTLENVKMAAEKKAQKDIQAWKDRYEDLKDELDMMRMDMNDMGGSGSGDASGALRQEVSSLKSKLSEKEQAIIQLGAELSGQASQYTQFQTRITSLEAQLREARQSARSTSPRTEAEPTPDLGKSTNDRTLRALQRELAVLQRTRDSLEQDLNSMEDLVSEKDIEIKALRAGLAPSPSHSPGSQDLSNDKVLQLQANLESVTSQLDAARHERDQLANSYSTFEQEKLRYQQAEADLYQTKSQLEGTRADLGKAQDTIQALQTEISSKIAQSNTLAKTLAEKEAQVVELETAVEAYKEELAKMDASEEQLRAELAHARQAELERVEESASGPSNEEYEALLEDLEKEKEDHAESLEEIGSLRVLLEQRDSDLQNRLDEATTQSMALQLKLDDAENTLSSAQTDYAALESRYLEALASVEQHGIQLAELEEELANRCSVFEAKQRADDLAEALRANQELEEQIQDLVQENMAKDQVLGTLEMKTRELEETTALASTEQLHRPRMSLLQPSQSGIPDLTLEELTPNTSHTFADQSTQSQSKLHPSRLSVSSASSMGQYDDEAIERILAAIDRLRAERDDLRTKLGFLQLENQFGVVPSGVEEATAALQREVEMKDSQIIEIDAQLSQKDTQLSQKDAQLLQQEQNLQEAAAQLNGMSMAFEQTSRDLQRTRRDLGKMQVTAAASMIVVSTYHQNLEHAESRIAQMEAQYHSAMDAAQERLVSETQALEERVAASDASRDTAQAEKAKLQSEKAKLQSDFHALQVQAVDFSDRLKDMKERYENARAHQMSSLPETDAVRQLKLDNKQLLERIDRREKQIADHQHDIQRRTMNLKLAEDGLEEMRVEVEDLASQLADCQNELACVKEDNDAVRSEREMDRRALKQMEEDKDGLESQLQVEQGKIAELGMRLSLSQQALIDLEDQRTTELEAVVAVVFDLRSRAASLHRELQTVRASSLGLRVDLEDRTRSEVELNEELRYYMVELDAVKAELAANTEELHRAKTQESTILDEMKKLKSDVQQAGADLEAKSTAYAKLDVKLQDLVAANEKLTADQASSQKTSNDLLSQVSKLEASHKAEATRADSVAVTLAEVEARRDQLLVDVQDLKRESEELKLAHRAEVEKRDETIRSLETNLAALDGLRASGAEDIEGLQQELDTVKDQLVQAQEDLEKQTALCDEAHQRIETLQQQTYDLQAHEDERADELVLAQTEYEHLEAELAKVQAEVTGLVAELEKVQTSAQASTDLVAELDAARTEIEALARDLDQSKADAQLIETEMEKKIESLEQDVVALTAKFGESEDKCAVAEERAAGFEAQLERKNAESDQWDDKAIEYGKEVKRWKVLYEKTKRKLEAQSTAVDESPPVLTAQTGMDFGDSESTSKPSAPEASARVTSLSDSRRPLSAFTNLSHPPPRPVSNKPNPLGLRLPPQSSRPIINRSLAPSPALSEDTKVQITPSSSNDMKDVRMTPPPPSPPRDEVPSVLKKRARDDDDDMPATPLPAEAIIARTPSSSRMRKSATRPSGFVPTRHTTKDATSPALMTQPPTASLRTTLASNSLGSSAGLPPVAKPRPIGRNMWANAPPPAAASGSLRAAPRGISLRNPLHDRKAT